MTDLTKKVTRRTDLDPKLGRKAAGPVSVTLYPNGDIGFRKLKCRKEVRIPLAHAYSMALKADAMEVMRQKRLAKQSKSGRRRN